MRQFISPPEVESILATHDKIYGEEYEEYLKQLKLIVLAKARETLSDEEIELLRIMKN